MNQLEGQVITPREKAQVAQIRFFRDLKIYQTIYAGSFLTTLFILILITPCESTVRALVTDEETEAQPRFEPQEPCSKPLH